MKSLLIFLATVGIGLGGAIAAETNGSRRAADEVSATLDAGAAAAEPAAATPSPTTSSTPPAITAPDPIDDTSGFLAWVKERRKDGSLFSWLIIVAFVVLAAVWRRLQPADPPMPDETGWWVRWRPRVVSIVAVALGLVALLADAVVGAGHFATVVGTVGPVVLALVMSPFVHRGEKAVPPPLPPAPREPLHTEGAFR